MSTFKSSVSALIIVASLSVTFATQVHAQESPSGGAPAGTEAIRDYVKKQGEDMQRHDAEWHRNQATTPPPPPVIKLEDPSLFDRCVSGVCTLIKWTSPLVWAAYEAIEPPNDKIDETKAQKEHDDAVHKAAKEQEKAKSQEKSQEKTSEPQKTSSSMPTEKTVNLKTVERKAVETRTLAPKSLESARSLNVSPVRTTVSISHLTVNVPRPTITVRIPTIVAHR